MRDVIDFPDLEYNIAADRTEELFEAARVLSDFIKDLPLGSADNEKLISLIIDQVNKG